MTLLSDQRRDLFCRFRVLAGDLVKAGPLTPLSASPQRPTHSHSAAGIALRVAYDGIRNQPAVMTTR
jgi:hypothetical protein